MTTAQPEEPLVPLESLDELDAAFRLPGFLRDTPDAQDLVVLYDVLVARMRRDFVATGLNTIQLLLIERVCYNYIIMRWKERQLVGDAQGFAHSTAQKEFNMFWLSLISELHKQIKMDDSVFKQAVVKSVIDAVSETLRNENPDTRKRIVSGLQVALTARGL